MAAQCPSVTPAGTTTTSSANNININTLIETANRNDRFKLLEDDSVLPANLTNTVHPLFHQIEANDKLHSALQLASHFLLHDRLLEFFVPLLHGLSAEDLPSKRTYLQNPLRGVHKARRVKLLSEVRYALQCLASHVEIVFAPADENLWARTTAQKIKSPLGSTCCKDFQGEMSPKIELSSEKFLQFYANVDGYAKATRCARFRHDFMLAVTLVHEIVHALGVMRRGNIIEPHYCADYPETEWGYAWENFMFGTVINPQDRTSFGTSVLMRKVWADEGTAKALGKEYCDVSMSWIAKWFRTETWNIIAEKGPISIEKPLTHFKIHLTGSSWYVYARDSAVCKDIADLSKQRQEDDLKRLESGEQVPTKSKASCKIDYRKCTIEELKRSNVPLPSRRYKRPKFSSTKTPVRSLLPPELPFLTSRDCSPHKRRQKRRADSDIDGEVLPKKTKRRKQVK